MNGNIDTIVENAQVEIKGAKNIAMLKTIKQKYVGANGLLTRTFKSSQQLPASFRSVRERAVNTAINKVTKQLEKRAKRDFNERI